VLELDQDLGDARSVVNQESMVNAHPSANDERSALRFQGLQRIAREVQEDLNQSIGVGQKLGQGGVEVALDPRVRGERIVGKQVEDVVEQTVQIHRGELNLLPARKDHEVIDECRDAIHFAHDQASRVARMCIARPQLKELRSTADS